MYKSGKVRMQLGSVPFRLSQGVPCEVRHDVAAVTAAGPQPRLVLLGDFEKRFVMTPDIGALLREQEEAVEQLEQQQPPRGGQEQSQF